MEILDRICVVLTSLHFLIIPVLPIKTVAPAEYCNRDTFNATCAPDEVIFMGMSRYGRMKIGKCVRTNLGYLGCAVDVIGLMDARCSGQSHCEVKVSDDALYQTRPCPPDTTSYLEASYSCVKVSVDKDRQCQKAGSIIVREQGGYLASRMAVEMGWGTADCPWVIHVDAGRTVNISLLNFGREAGSDPSSPGILSPDSSICYELGTIYEGDKHKDILTCGSDVREKHIEISQTNKIQIAFAERSVLRSLGYFVLRFEATGCPDPQIPANAFIQRDGDSAIVRCNFSDDTWYTVCQKGIWTGQLGKCPDGSKLGIFGSGPNFPYGILIVVAIGVALGVFFGGLLLSIAIFYVKRRQATRQPPETSYETQGEALREPVGPKDFGDELERGPQWGTYSSSAGYPGQYSDGTLGQDKHHITDYGHNTLPLPTSKDYGSRNHIYESPQFS